MTTGDGSFAHIHYRTKQQVDSPPLRLADSRVRRFATNWRVTITPNLSDNFWMSAGNRVEALVKAVKG